jgi:hypothetical protein
MGACMGAPVDFGNLQSLNEWYLLVRITTLLARSCTLAGLAAIGGLLTIDASFAVPTSPSLQQCVARHRVSPDLYWWMTLSEATASRIDTEQAAVQVPPSPCMLESCNLARYFSNPS